MRFPLFGLNIKACLVFILGVLFITYVTARPVAGLEPDLLSRSNQLVKVHISFPGGTKEFLQRAATRNVREAIIDTLEEYTPPGHEIEVIFPTPLRIPAFNKVHEIDFRITLDNGATGTGLVEAVGEEPNYEDGPFVVRQHILAQLIAGMVKAKL
ncbi:hypothetical protein F5876DRAFT_77331 [Lentinula aff. lateritia]|uniref:Uncharacterized protein n=1 Tax=Lentinula aff. lateritia TaxID=2804960 RepID=A0ACC1TYK2_9AGAR|nr:hypothetical protein F5876DRAFT_77331 [Lentinula aff. lateritia]